ncbi:unnamed protein product [Oppiella nova]|uniref:Bicarbonate transporter-like transmembrane domain-containing protein n=1 Tax=Oppiella nova TaxID=334625 RepID=A0A7R9LU01_9ACAR|nr:unnamed protein product [Oppiella nova]CAG2166832.1 unnamed protein product [Oppiella nova]
MPELKLISFVSNFGGQLGMWLGINLKSGPNMSTFKAGISRLFSRENSLHDEDSVQREEILISRNVQIIGHKDFKTEFRCKRDINLFVSNYHILLDCKAINLESIVNNILTYYKYYSCSLPSIKRRQICIARLSEPTNLGITSHNIKFFILILAPLKEKLTKSSQEISHTFATLFADIYFRLDLINAKTEQQFIEFIDKRVHRLTNKTTVHNLSAIDELRQKYEEKQTKKFGVSFGSGLIENFKRRSNYYLSDYIDGFVGPPKTIHKTVATTVSLYFAILLPCIAFGVRDHNNTNALIDTRRALIGQTIGGAVFALLSGQPLVIIMTTAPLCLYTKVVYDISYQLEVDFYDMFGCVGLWNVFFVLMYAFFDVSYLMKWCTRSTEEIFGLFSFFAFLIEPIKDCIQNYYCFDPPVNTSTSCGDCSPQSSVLFVLLMLLTVWLAVAIYNFNASPYLDHNKREILADYALPIAVISISFVGTYLFRHVNVYILNNCTDTLTLTAAALVNNPSNKLKKGDAYHWDLLVVGLLNIFLSVFGLPWMNGMLPHSPIHARSLADIQQTVDPNGQIRERVVRGRETRVTGLATHILIGLSLLLIPEPLDYIPVPVLNGLFLYCAIASLRGNSFVERMLLFVTEQTAYPPNHYIRRCPQKLIHAFTMIQIIQSAVLCFFAFSVWPYVQMAYPVVIAILIPIRYSYL